MSILQPISTDILNSPDHSLLHRVIAADDSSPAQSLTVNASGSSSMNKGVVASITTVTDTYLILATDYTVICNKTTNFTVTLPSALVIGQIYNIKNINTGQVTLAGANGTDTIDTATSQTLLQWDSLTIQCRANYKWVIL